MTALPRPGNRSIRSMNIQMNYWPAELLGLAECHEPLFDLIHRMLPNGRDTAREMYGAGVSRAS